MKASKLSHATNVLLLTEIRALRSELSAVKNKQTEMEKASRVHFDMNHVERDRSVTKGDEVGSTIGNATIVDTTTT